MKLLFFTHLKDEIGTHLDATRGNKLGVVVHSMRAASTDSIQSIANEAEKRDLQVHVHLEEQQKEIKDCLDVHNVTPLDLLMKTVTKGESTKKKQVMLYFLLILFFVVSFVTFLYLIIFWLYNNQY